MVMIKNTRITSLILLSTAVSGQGFLKYSTLYASVYGATPMEAPTEYFVTQVMLGCND